MKNWLKIIPASIWLFLLLAFMCLFCFWDFLSFEKLYLFKDIGSDTLNLFYPHFLHISDYLRTDGFPRWSFNQGVGQNITNSGIDNPFNLLLYSINKGQIAYAIVYVEIAKIILCGLITYHWLLLLTKSKQGAFWGGMAFAFSGYVIVGSTWYVHSYFCLTTVLILLAFELGYQKNNWLLMPIAIFMAFGVNLLFTAQFMALYFAFRLYIDGDFSKAKGTFIKATLFAFLGILLKAPLLGSIFQRIFESPRITDGLPLLSDIGSFELIESVQFYYTLFLRFISNDLLGNGSNYHGWNNYLEAPLFYVGITTILLACSLFIVGNNRLKKAFFVFGVFWLALLIFPFLRYCFYWFSGDYFKNGLSCFIPLTIIMAAAFSLKLIDKKWLKFSSLAFVLLTAELAFTAYSTINKRNTVTTKEFTEKGGYNDFTVEALEFLNGHDTSFYRIEKKYPSTLAGNASLNDAKVFNYFGTDAYASFNQASYIEFLSQMQVINSNEPESLKWIEGVKNRKLLSNFLGVKYKLYKHPFKDENLSKLRTFAYIDVYQNPNAYPLGFTINNYITKSDFEALPLTQKDCVIARALIADDKTALNFKLRKIDLNDTLLCGYNDFSQDFKLKRFSQNLLEFKGGSKRGIFLTTIPFDKGWNVNIVENGVVSEIESFKANYGFLAFPINEKDTEIRLYFIPPFFYLGWVIAGLALIFYLVLSFKVVRRKKIAD